MCVGMKQVEVRVIIVQCLEQDFILDYGKRQGTLKSDSEWRGEWRMGRRTANGERRGEH